MILPIIQLPKEDFINQNNILRKKSQNIINFGSKFQEEVDNLIETFEKNSRGVGLSAPQVGVFKRFAVINPKKKEDSEHLIIVNPEIITATGKKIAKKEACLSLPGFKGSVVRRRKLKLRYQDRFGEVKENNFTDFKARIIFHEIDHLDGVLYVDRMLPNDLLEEFKVENNDNSITTVQD